MKRIVSIQDVSALGKCSLTVALPIISAMGIECAVVPTAVLSTHTQFQGWTFHDLTDEMEPIADHWKQQRIGFDGIATGYLGSFRQIELVEELFREFDHPGMLRFVDPAMGDNGTLYVGFDESFARRMGELPLHKTEADEYLPRGLRVDAAEVAAARWDDDKPVDRHLLYRADESRRRVPRRLAVAAAAERPGGGLYPADVYRRRISRE